MIKPAVHDTPKRKCVTSNIEIAQAQLNTARPLRTDWTDTSSVCHSVESKDHEQVPLRVGGRTLESGQVRRCAALRATAWPYL